MKKTQDFDPLISRATIGAIKEFQEERLRSHIAHLAAKSVFYQRRFKEDGINPALIRTLEDLLQIRPVTKDDLHRFNDEFVSVSPKEIADYCTTSGTIGDPVSFALNKNDLGRLARNEALSFSTAGCLPGETIQLMTTLDKRFMAGLAYFLGAQELGCGVIRVGGGVPSLQWDSILRFKPTSCVVVPSFLLKLADYAKKNNIDHRLSSLKRAICIGEPIRNPDLSPNKLAQKIAEVWGIELIGTYASTEMATAFTECCHGVGGHLQPELAILEILDENNRPVSEGEVGEITVTPLGIEGMPLLRFKTGDLAAKFDAPCACGRTTPRLGPVIGRRQQMIKYKGTTLYPPALYEVLNQIPGVENFIIEVKTNDIETDEILIRIGTNRSGQDFFDALKEQFVAKIRVTPKFVLETPEQVQKDLFPEAGRKPVPFVDKRI